MHSSTTTPATLRPVRRTSSTASTPHTTGDDMGSHESQEVSHYLAIMQRSLKPPCDRVAVLSSLRMAFDTVTTKTGAIRAPELLSLMSPGMHEQLVSVIQSGLPNKKRLMTHLRHFENAEFWRLGVVDLYGLFGDSGVKLSMLRKARFLEKYCDDAEEAMGLLQDARRKRYEGTTQVGNRAKGLEWAPVDAAAALERAREDHPSRSGVTSRASRAASATSSQDQEDETETTSAGSPDSEEGLSPQQGQSDDDDTPPSPASEEDEAVDNTLAATTILDRMRSLHGSQGINPRTPEMARRNSAPPRTDDSSFQSLATSTSPETSTPTFNDTAKQHAHHTQDERATRLDLQVHDDDDDQLQQLYSDGLAPEEDTSLFQLEPPEPPATEPNSPSPSATEETPRAALSKSIIGAHAAPQRQSCPEPASPQLNYLQHVNMSKRRKSTSFFEPSTAKRRNQGDADEPTPSFNPETFDITNEVLDDFIRQVAKGDSFQVEDHAPIKDVVESLQQYRFDHVDEEDADENSDVDKDTHNIFIQVGTAVYASGGQRSILVWANYTTKRLVLFCPKGYSKSVVSDLTAAAQLNDPLLLDLRDYYLEQPQAQPQPSKDHACVASVVAGLVTGAARPSPSCTAGLSLWCYVVYCFNQQRAPDGQQAINFRSQKDTEADVFQDFQENPGWKPGSSRSVLSSGVKLCGAFFDAFNDAQQEVCAVRDEAVAVRKLLQALRVPAQPESEEIGKLRSDIDSLQAAVAISPGLASILNDKQKELATALEGVRGAELPIVSNLDTAMTAAIADATMVESAFGEAIKRLREQTLRDIETLQARLG
ncbi:Hypothetical predicted protein [Lecanosticta acicola]|uniref:Uncharacterized protein n=1 Tax=Lecanosticta acicola TaxID=111012 RepID=A0AAI8Z8E3_9PEZI|nr:Hypothetical predicted protein [Lecanosticta acicola]